MPDPVSYSAVLPVREDTALFVSGLLAAARVRRGTAAVCDGTRVEQLAGDTQVSVSTASRYLHEGIDVLAAAPPDLHGALLAARAAGHRHVSVDGTLIYTDRSRAAGPSHGVDLWWSGKHRHHGGNIQVIAAPDGWPLWTSDVRPGREHDTTCLRAHPELLPVLAAGTDAEHAVLGDLGYEGENPAITTPIKRRRGVVLTVDQRIVNALHAATRALAKRANSLLKTTFKALRRVSLCPWRIGAITAAALVLLHREHDRTTRSLDGYWEWLRVRRLFENSPACLTSGFCSHESGSKSEVPQFRYIELLW